MNSRNTHVAAILVLLFLWIQLMPYAEAKDTEIMSSWTPHAITLDGSRSDWPASGLTTVPDREASLGLCNDSQNVYVMLCFRNDQWARVIKFSGLTLYLDPSGKKKKTFMLKLTGGPSAEEIMKATGRPSRPVNDSQAAEMRGRMENRFRKNDTTLSCAIQDYLVEKTIPIDGSQGPGAAFGVDQGFFVYEFKIPLKESSVMYYGLGSVPTKPISVGLIWGDIDREKMGGEGGGFHGRMGGGGGFGGGGMGGGYPGGGGHRGGGMGGQGNRQAPEKQEVWVKATLSAGSSSTN